MATGKEVKEQASKSKRVSQNPKVMRHSCSSYQQDEMYGPGMRLFNSTAKAGVYRCTVCGKEG